MNTDRWVDYPWAIVGAIVGCLFLSAGLICTAWAVFEWWQNWDARHRQAPAAPSTQDARPLVDEAQAWADFVRLHRDVDHRLNRIDVAVQRRRHQKRRSQS